MGAGSTNSKFIRVNSSLTKLDTNKYRLTVNLSTSSAEVYNGYGVRCYVTMDGVKGALIGTYTISNGVCSPSSFTYDFTITKTVTVGAKVICSYCEDGLHDEYKSQFTNQTVEDTATYVNPLPNAPGSPTSVTASGKYEKSSTITLSYPGATGTVSGYDIEYRIDGGAWRSLTSPTSNTYSYTVSSIDGYTIQYRVRAKNAGGTSAWKESNTLQHYGIKVYNGSSFVWGTIKVFNGSSWQNAKLKVYASGGWTLSK